MAELLKKLEDQLNCPICLDTYTDPKQLQCNHVYCQQCLVKLVIQDQQRQLSLTCPNSNCHQVTPVPTSGVIGLQPAFQINQLLDIMEEHKKSASSITKKVESVSASSTPHASITAGCLEHSGKEVKLYCETCGETICWKCTMKGSKHHSHEFEKLDKAFEQYEQEMMASLQPLEEQLATIKKSLEDLDICCGEITDQQTTIEANINSTIAQLHETLDARKTELVGQLHKLTQAKLKSLAVQRDQIETTQAQLSSYLLFMRENLKTDNQREALMMKNTTIRQVKELSTTFQPDMLEPNTKANIIFATLEDLHAKCKSYGQVYASGTPDASYCHVTGENEKTALVGEKFIDTLQLLNSGSKPCTVSMTSIYCELISEITGSAVRGSVQGKKGQGEYKISCQPTVKGMHQLHIKVRGHHIRDSPFPVSVRSPVEKLGTPILTIDGLRRPEGIAINQKGEIVVTERTKHCITVFSSAGERLRSFGTSGSGDGQFRCPAGVVVDGDGNIIVADSHNERIQTFTAQGEFLKAVDTSGIVYPLGLTLNRSNSMIYACDGSDSGHVTIMYPNLTRYGTLGKRGSGKGQLYYPKCIACDSAGNVYVTDHNNYRIQVFTVKGKFLRMFGSKGDGPGELNSPCGIAIDSSDKVVYVSEDTNHRVSVFTTYGQFVTSFGSEGNGPGKFCYPYGLAVDSSGVVYVCDQINDRVQLF